MTLFYDRLNEVANGGSDTNDTAEGRTLIQRDTPGTPSSPDTRTLRGTLLLTLLHYCTLHDKSDEYFGCTRKLTNNPKASKQE